MLGAIDLAFFQLCDSCICSDSIHEVDFGKNCLSNLRKDILGNHFQANIPVYLTSSNKKVRDLDDDDSTELAREKMTKRNQG